jgi:hypothetical protein
MKVYIFYYEVLVWQSRIINGLLDFHQKEKMKKSPKNIESFPPHPPGGGQH